MTANLELDHFAIAVSDIPSRVSWYVENFQATVDYSDETWAMLDINGIKLALVLIDQHPPHLAFCVPNLEALGPDYREHRDGSRYVYKCDPDGNTIELVYWGKNNDK